MNRCIIWGGTGQAKVLRPVLEQQGFTVVAMFDNREVPSPFRDIPLLGDWSAFKRQKTEFAGAGFIVAIGGANGGARARISRDIESCGLVPLTAIHERAFVGQTARLGAGCQILAMAAVCEGARLGDYTIVNTNASVDHDCEVGNGAHIMPGATVAGEVVIGDFVTIGSNATVLPRVRIGARATVGAGAVVTRDVPADTVVVGAPARARPETDAGAAS